MALRIVVVGLGGRGRDWVQEIRRHPGWELAGTAETDPQVRRRAIEEMDLTPDRCFESLDHALERLADCHAALVATPADVHVEPCRSAFSRGLAVLVEKPFTTCLADAIALVRQAEEARLPLMVAQNHRYLRSHRTVRRLLRDGVLGRVGLVVSHYYRVPHQSPPSLARLPHRMLWQVGVHHLDALRYVLDQEVVGVLANSFSFPGGADLEGNTLEVLLEFEGGTRATYGATYESRGHEYFGAGQEFYERLVGERATLHVIHRWLLLCKPGKLPRVIRRGSRPRTEEAVLLQQLTDSILTGVEAECSGRDNLQTVAILEACVRSAADRRWVNPQELLGEAG